MPKNPLSIYFIFNHALTCTCICLIIYVFFEHINLKSHIVIVKFVLAIATLFITLHNFHEYQYSQRTCCTVYISNMTKSPVVKVRNIHSKQRLKEIKKEYAVTVFEPRTHQNAWKHGSRKAKLGWWGWKMCAGLGHKENNVHVHDITCKEDEVEGQLKSCEHYWWITTKRIQILGN